MKHIVFDIETIPQDEAKLLALAPEFTAPANLKDPEKIAAAIAKKRADYLADAALNWKTAEVVLIGAGDDTGIQSFTAGTEKELVGNFLTLLGDALADGVAVGGHNVKGFDLPMLVNRARVHGLKIPTHGALVLEGPAARGTRSVFDTLEIVVVRQVVRGQRRGRRGAGVRAAAEARAWRRLSDAVARGSRGGAGVQPARCGDRNRDRAHLRVHLTANTRSARQRDTE